MCPDPETTPKNETSPQAGEFFSHRGAISPPFRVSSKDTARLFFFWGPRVPGAFGAAGRRQRAEAQAALGDLALGTAVPPLAALGRSRRRCRGGAGGRGAAGRAGVKTGPPKWMGCQLKTSDSATVFSSFLFS